MRIFIDVTRSLLESHERRKMLVVATLLAPLCGLFLTPLPATPPAIVAAQAWSPPASSLLARKFAPEEIEKKEYTEQDIADAKTKGLLLLLFGAAPSFYAQNELVWKKEKEGKQVFGKKKSKK